MRAVTVVGVKPHGLRCKGDSFLLTMRVIGVRFGNSCRCCLYPTALSAYLVQYLQDSTASSLL